MIPPAPTKNNRYDDTLLIFDKITAVITASVKMPSSRKASIVNNHVSHCHIGSLNGDVHYNISDGNTGTTGPVLAQSVAARAQGNDAGATNSTEDNDADEESDSEVVKKPKKKKGANTKNDNSMNGVLSATAAEASADGLEGLDAVMEHEIDSVCNSTGAHLEEENSDSNDDKGRNRYRREWREASALKNQVEKIGKIPFDGSTVQYWLGDMNNGGFVSVNQLSVVGDVKVYGTRYFIRGAIAETETDKLVIVPEERMKKNIQVYVGPQSIPSTQETGFIQFDGTGGASYARINYFGRSVWQEKYTITTHVSEERNRKNPNRDLSKSDTRAKHLMATRKDQISAKQKVAVLDLMCLHNVNISSARHSGLGTCDNAWCYHRLEDVSQYCGSAQPDHEDADKERICVKANDIVQDFRGYIGPSTLANVSQLIEEGSDEAAFVLMWHNLETFKDMMKSAVDDRFCTYYRPREVQELKAELEQRWEDSEQGQMNNRMKDYFVLTMTFEKLSCKRPGHLHASKVAGAQTGTFCDLYNAHMESKNQATRKPPHNVVVPKMLCHSEGCTTFAHRSCGMYCWHHSNKKKVPMCIKCLKKPSRKAKLCHTCLKDNVDETKQSWCIECKVRQSRAINSRCGVCANITKKCSSCGIAYIKIQGKCVKCFTNEGGKRKRCNRCDKNVASRKGGLCLRCYGAN